jgi:hypothetical protein
MNEFQSTTVPINQILTHRIVQREYLLDAELENRIVDYRPESPEEKNFPGKNSY